MLDHYAPGLETPDRPRNRNTTTGVDYFQFHSPRLDSFFLTTSHRSESMVSRSALAEVVSA